MIIKCPECGQQRDIRTFRIEKDGDRCKIRCIECVTDGLCSETEYLRVEDTFFKAADKIWDQISTGVNTATTTTL